MSDPVTLKTIQETAAALNKCGIATLEDLRMCLSKDVDTGIHRISINTGASQALLMALLIAEVRDDAGKKGKRELLSYWRSLKALPAVLSLSAIEIKELWSDKKLQILWEGRKPVGAVLRQSVVRPMRLGHNWRRFLPDVLTLFILPLLLVGLAFRANSLNKKKVQYVAVVQGTSLPVFHKIAGEVEMKTVPGFKGSFTNIDQVCERYTLAAIPAGAMLQSNQLLSAELSKKMQGRKILSVPLKTGAYSATLSPPSQAIMVLSPRALDLKASEPIHFDVILLSVENNGDARSAIVAMQEDKFKIAAPLLASHDVFLSQTVP
jgi:hypothetical protein